MVKKPSHRSKDNGRKNSSDEDDDDDFVVSSVVSDTDDDDDDDDFVIDSVAKKPIRQSKDNGRKDGFQGRSQTLGDSGKENARANDQHPASVDATNQTLPAKGTSRTVRETN